MTPEKELYCAKLLCQSLSLTITDLEKRKKPTAAYKKKLKSTQGKIKRLGNATKQ